jgi:cold shock CspA family protein
MADDHSLRTETEGMTGTIKSLIADRGYGFIRSADGRDVFFHRGLLPAWDFDRLGVGALVRFREDSSCWSPKGPRAAAVTLLDGPRDSQR